MIRTTAQLPEMMRHVAFISSLLLLFSCLLCADDIQFGANMRKIAEMERDGKWAEALPIYKQLEGRLRNALDGLTPEFLYRKGVCEFHCKLYREAEASFRDVREFAGERDTAWKYQSLFRLAECQLQTGENRSAEQSLNEALKFASELGTIDAGLKKWGSLMTQRIRDGIKRHGKEIGLETRKEK